MVKRRLSLEAKDEVIKYLIEGYEPTEISRILALRAEKEGLTWKLSRDTVHRIKKTWKEHGARFSLNQLEEYRNLMESNKLIVRRLWGCYSRADNPVDQSKILHDVSDVQYNRFRMMPKPSDQLVLQLIQDNRQLTVVQNIDLTRLEAVDLRALAEYRELGHWPQEQLPVFHGENPRVENSESPTTVAQTSDTDTPPPPNPSAP